MPRLWRLKRSALAAVMVMATSLTTDCEPSGIAPTPRSGLSPTIPAPPLVASVAPTSALITPTPLVTSPALQYAQTTSWQLPADPQVDRMREAILLTFSRCQIAFPGQGGEVRGFLPGADYPMIYVRDTATILSAARYFYPDDYLRSSLEEFLGRQYDQDTESENGHRPGAGAISAVIAPDGHIDKATATSDEETSLIHAAYVYYRAKGGDDWLRKTINGRTVLERLNAALEWLYSQRFEPGLGLIIRGHTTDWGDVKFEPAANPTDIDPSRDHWTASIYDQAVTYRALLELAEMNQALGAADRVQLYRQRATDLRRRANEQLWMEDKGYYRLHVHVTPLEHPFDEDAIVAVGNVAAIRCGLTTPQQERAILAVLEQTRLTAGAARPGVSLYPPYPRGFFAYGQMTPGRYQNGGVWDWWGGQQISAEFERGHSERARQHLALVATGWAAHPEGLYEWHLPGTDQGRGSLHYCASAAALAEAIIGGLYGVSLDRQGVVLSPRLSHQDGYVRVYQPATDIYAAYDYRVTAGGIVLEYGCNDEQPLTLRMLLPAGTAIQGLAFDAGALEVVYAIEVVGDDTYCVLKVPSGLHRLELRLTRPG